MTDNVPVNPGSQPNAFKVAVDKILGIVIPIFKISYGATGSQTPVSPVNPLPVVAGDSITVDNIKSQYVVQGVDDTVTVHLDTGEVSTQTAFMLIDLSDIINWKHVNTGHTNLKYLIIEADPDSIFLGEIKFGFLSNVDIDDGDFNQVLDIDMRKKSDLLVEPINLGSHGMHLDNAHHFGPIILNSILFQTDLNLGGPNDPSTITYPSGDGDFVMLITVSAGTINVSVTFGYQTVTD